MDPFEFEAAVAELLAYRGFEDVRRNGRYDMGADIVAVRDGERTAVQVKRWNNLVDLGAVRQLVDGMKRYDCARGLLVTNSFLTEPAIACADTWDVEVWDRWTLAEYLDGDEPTIDTSVCAECGRGVSAKVTEWCLSHPGRYLGFVYCRAHQSRSRRRS